MPDTHVVASLSGTCTDGAGTDCVCMHEFSILCPMDEVRWAVLEVADSIAWKWERGRPYTHPPALNLLAIGDHTCMIKVGSNGGNLGVHVVFVLFSDIEKRRRMASIKMDQHGESWYKWDP